MNNKCTRDYKPKNFQHSDSRTMSYNS